MNEPVVPHARRDAREVRERLIEALNKRGVCAREAKHDQEYKFIVGVGPTSFEVRVEPEYKQNHSSFFERATGRVLVSYAHYPQRKVRHRTPKGGWDYDKLADAIVQYLTEAREAALAVYRGILADERGQTLVDEINRKHDLGRGTMLRAEYANDRVVLRSALMTDQEADEALTVLRAHFGARMGSQAQFERERQNFVETVSSREEDPTIPSL